jgi:cellulose synthase/poly-beta-1,6-N-acetylglucosamine synthase-like glycosyltransferase
MSLELIQLFPAAIVFVYAHLNYLLSLGLMALPLPKSKKHSMFRWPSVSVIIPTRNEAAVIGATMKAVAALKYPGKLETVLVDSSADNTREIAKKYGVKIISDPGRGKPAALNIAVKAAKGEVLYFLDADSRPGTAALKELVSALSPETPVAVGPALPHNCEKMSARMARLYLAFLAHLQAASSRLLRSTLIAGRNFVIYKKTLLRLGCFEESLTEDLNLSLKMSRRGLKAAFVATATSRETVPHRLPWYLRQQERWIAGSLLEVAANIRGAKKRVKLLWTPASLLLAYSPAAALALAAAGLASASAFLLAGAGLAYLLFLASSLRLLRPSDSVLSPLSFALLSVLQAGVIAKVLAKMSLSRPFAWHKTPKE